jgi:hypothetical protein
VGATPTAIVATTVIPVATIRTGAGVIATAIFAPTTLYTPTIVTAFSKTRIRVSGTENGTTVFGTEQVRSIAGLRPSGKLAGTEVGS